MLQLSLMFVPDIKGKPTGDIFGVVISAKKNRKTLSVILNIILYKDVKSNFFYRLKY